MGPYGPQPGPGPNGDARTIGRTCWDLFGLLSQETSDKKRLILGKHVSVKVNAFLGIPTSNDAEFILQFVKRSDKDSE